MNLFDQLFFNSFNLYKKSAYKKKANSISIYYITLVQCSFLLVFGVLLAVFLRQLHVETMSANKAWVLFIITTFVIYFKNWMHYSGKKRKIINAKSHNQSNYNLVVLWLIPISTIILTLIFLRVF